MQELKIRISNSNEIEEKLVALGAVFIEEFKFTDTYFNQSSGKVLKLASNDHETNLINLESVDSKFNIVSKQNIKNVNDVKKELSDKYGIKTVLQGKRKYFTFGDLKLTLNFIDDIGQFLIITGENPTEEFITEKLDIKNPEYISVSFDELKQ